MAGLIGGSMGSGVGSALMGIGDDIDKQRQLASIQAERMAEFRMRDQDRADRERDNIMLRQQMAAGQGGGKNAQVSAAEGGLGEEAMAARMNMSIPELRQFRKANSTGDLSGYDTKVPLPGPTEDGSALVGKQRLPGFDAEGVKAKRQMLADIADTYQFNGNYDDVTKGRRTELGNQVGRGIIGGAISPAAGGEKIGALEGKGAYDGDSNVTRNKYSGDTTSTDVGKSVITENNAKAKKATDEADGKVKPRDLIQGIDAQRKALDSELADLRASRKAEIDAALSPTKKQQIIDAYKTKEDDIKRKRSDLDSQFDELRRRQEMPTRTPAKTGDNGNVKSPSRPPISSFFKS